jgi:hypothetical protein
MSFGFKGLINFLVRECKDAENVQMQGKIKTNCGTSAGKVLSCLIAEN